jgi:hypothetical protein
VDPNSFQSARVPYQARILLGDPIAENRMDRATSE